MVATIKATAPTAERLSAEPFPVRALRFHADKGFNAGEEPISRRERSDIGGLPQGSIMNP
jgi:hypothetical protein